MIAAFDQDLQRLVKSLNPKWTEIRARKLGFQQRNEMSFVTEAIMLVGEHLCCVVSTLKTCQIQRWNIIQFI